MKLKAELLIVALGRVLNAALLLLGFTALTRMLPPSEYLFIALLNAFSSFAGLVLINPAGQWTNRHHHEWYVQGILFNQLGKLMRHVACAAVVGGTVAAIWYFMMPIGGAIESCSIGIVIASTVYFSTACLSYAAILNSLGHRRSAVLTQLVVTALGLLFAVILTHWHSNAAMWLTGLALGAMVAFVGARHEFHQVLARDSEPKSSGNSESRAFIFQKDFLQYAYPLVSVTALMWLDGNGYRFILERVWTARELGLFLMALSVPAQLTTILETIIAQFTNPYFFRAIAGANGKENIGRITETMISTLLPLYWIWGGCLFLIAPQFMYLVAGAAYHEAANWIAFGVLLEVARLTGNAWLLSSQACKDYSPMTVPFAVGALGSVLICLLVAALDGSATAVVSGMVFAAILKCAFIIIRARVQLPIRISLKRAGLTATLLLSGLALYGPLMHNKGVWISLLIMLGASGTALLFGYIHLRTAQDFRLLLQQKLG